MSSLIDKATFGMGCFWFAEALFGATQGVITTKVGYSGGTSSEPNYYAISDHIETVEMTFDTQQTTYEVSCY
jgi:peptide-methionine (S)-S-oxide reductase